MDDRLEVTRQSDVVEQPPQRQVPVRDDGELEAEAAQALECTDDARNDFEADCARVPRRELVDVELRSDRFEEDACAVALQSCKAGLVMAFGGVLRVVRDLRAKSLRDDAGVAFDIS